jgi:NAD(P)H-hydrate epimerase
MEKYKPGESYVVMSRDEVRAFDRWAIETVGIPGMVLMENAARSCAELIKEKLLGVAKPLAWAAKPDRKVCIFCGTGNNGGDGYVIARHLINSGFTVVVVLCGDRNKVKGDAKTNLEILVQLGQPIEELQMTPGKISSQVERLAAGADMIVDALFGTGLSGHLSEEYVELIESINAAGCPVLAVDIPSGLDCDTGKVLGAAVHANYTVTFVAVKKGFVNGAEAQKYTGEIYVASIGVKQSGTGT